MFMKKILISANTSWYIFNFRKNTIKALIANGYKVITLAATCEKKQDLENLGAEFIQLQFNPKGTNIFSEALTLIKFLNFYRKIQPDLILHFTTKNNLYGSMAASILGIKVINNVSGLGKLFIKDGIKKNFMKLLYRISYNNSHYIFFQNKRDFDEFCAFMPKIKLRSCIIPGSGVDLNKFKINSPTKPSKDISFLFFSRMLKDKGINILIESIRNLKSRHKNFNMQFNLLGFTDPADEDYVSISDINVWEKEGLVKYHGETDDVHRYISSSDCIILPSFYREGTPKSLLEALAMSKPIITTNLPGCADTVDDGKNGYLCEPQSVKSLTEAIEKFINLSFDERITMGQLSRKKAELVYDEKIIISEYSKRIRQAFSQN